MKIAETATNRQPAGYVNTAIRTKKPEGPPCRGSTSMAKPPGNIVGGTALFALISYAQVMEEI